MVAQVILLATRGELAGRGLTLQGPAQCRIGRSRSCTLRLPGDESVSRQHCMLDIEPDAVRVQDLGSLNGTFINGQNISAGPPRGDDGATMCAPPPRRLAEGDMLQIGHHVFRVKLVEEGPDDAEVCEKEQCRGALCG